LRAQTVVGGSFRARHHNWSQTPPPPKQEVDGRAANPKSEISDAMSDGKFEIRNPKFLIPNS
jgi:hypothetical protein